MRGTKVPQRRNDLSKVSGCWSRAEPPRADCHRDLSPCTTWGPAHQPLSWSPHYPLDSGGPGKTGGGLSVPLLSGRRLGGIKHLLPAFHPRHGLHILPPVTHLHGPLLRAGHTHIRQARGCTGPSKHRRNWMEKISLFKKIGGSRHLTQP